MAFDSLLLEDLKVIIWLGHYYVYCEFWDMLS